MTSYRKDYIYFLPKLALCGTPQTSFIYYIFLFLGKERKES